MKLLILLSILLKLSAAARILAIIPSPLYSHQVAFRNIIKELSKKHEVVLITPIPINDATLSNLTEIFVSDVERAINRLVKEKSHLWKSSIHGLNRDFLEPLFKDSYNAIFEHPQVQQLLTDPKEKFDLVICEVIFEILSMFAVHFDCPLIGLTPCVPRRKWLSEMGNPIMPSVLAHQEIGKVANLRFLDKLMSLLYYTEILYSPEDTFFPSLHHLTRKYFGFEHFNLFKKMDMLFVYSNPILSVHLPSIPTVVEIGGGTHMNPPQELHTDMKKFLDSSKGTIYVSLGTTVALFPIYQVISEALLQIFAELPNYNFLWRVEGGDKNYNIPKNVKAFNWGPQQDILGHPKIIGFVMQGGQQSLEETLHAQVPVLLIPFLGDQFINADIVKRFDIGRVLNLEEFTKESFKEALMDLINNQSYKANIKRLAELSLDQPMSGLEKAIWWAEYTMRHKGAKHLRNDVADMSTFEYYLIDVLICVVLFLTIVWFAIYKYLKMLSTKKVKEE